jgi:hypothetical protein
MVKVFCLPLFVLVSWLMPWWCMGLAAFACGLIFRYFKGGDRRAGVLSMAFWGAISSATVTWLRDRESGYVIAGRMAGVFNFPSGWGMYFLMSLIGLVTVAVWYQAGLTIGPKRQSANG